MIRWHPRSRTITTAPLLLLLLAPSAGAAEWSLQSSAQAFTQRENNPRMLPGFSRDARSGVLEGSVAMRRSTESAALALSASGSVRRYSEDRSLDRDEQRLALDWQRAGERWHLDASLGAVRDTTLSSELGSTGLTQFNLRHEEITATVAPGWRLSERTQLGMSAGWRSNFYPDGRNTGLSDYRYLFTAANLDWQWTERTTLSLQAGASELDSDATGSGTRSMDARIELRYTWNLLWSGSLSGGPSRVRTGAVHQGGSVFAATLTRNAGRSAVTAALERGAAPTGRGLLSRRDQASLRLTGLLAENADLSIGVGYLRSKEFLPSGGLRLGDVRYLRADGSVFWRLTPNWSIGLSAGHSRQEQKLQDAIAHGFDGRFQVAWRRSSPLG